MINHQRLTLLIHHLGLAEPLIERRVVGDLLDGFAQPRFSRLGKLVNLLKLNAQPLGPGSFGLAFLITFTPDLFKDLVLAGEPQPFEAVPDRGEKPLQVIEYSFGSTCGCTFANGLPSLRQFPRFRISLKGNRSLVWGGNSP